MRSAITVNPNGAPLPVVRTEHRVRAGGRGPGQDPAALWADLRGEYELHRPPAGLGLHRRRASRPTHWKRPPATQRALAVLRWLLAGPLYVLRFWRAAFVELGRRLARHGRDIEHWAGTASLLGAAAWCLLVAWRSQ